MLAGGGGCGSSSWWDLWWGERRGRLRRTGPNVQLASPSTWNPTTHEPLGKIAVQNSNAHCHHEREGPRGARVCRASTWVYMNKIQAQIISCKRSASTNMVQGHDVHARVVVVVVPMVLQTALDKCRYLPPSYTKLGEHMCARTAITDIVLTCNTFRSTYRFRANLFLVRENVVVNLSGLVKRRGQVRKSLSGRAKRARRKRASDSHRISNA